MKNTEKVIERLVRKQIAVANAIASILRRKKMNQKEFALSVPVRESFVSRIVSGYGTNVTLETIAKFEAALDEDILVTPDEYEHKLVDNADRLVVLIEASMKKDPAANIKIWDAANQYKNIDTRLKIPEQQKSYDSHRATFFSMDKETADEINNRYANLVSKEVGKGNMIVGDPLKDMSQPYFTEEDKSLLRSSRRRKKSGNITRTKDLA